MKLCPACGELAKLTPCKIKPFAEQCNLCNQEDLELWSASVEHQELMEEIEDNYYFHHLYQEWREVT